MAERALWISGAVVAAALILGEIISWKKTNESTLELKQNALENALACKELAGQFAKTIAALKTSEANKPGSKVAELVQQFSKTN